MTNVPPRPQEANGGRTAARISAAREAAARREARVTAIGKVLGSLAAGWVAYRIYRRLGAPRWVALALVDAMGRWHRTNELLKERK